MSDQLDGTVASSTTPAPEGAILEAVSTPQSVEGTPPVPAQEASTTESAPVVDTELESKPGFQNLRSQYQSVKAELEALKSTQLTTESAPDSYLTLDAPVEDWDVVGHLEKLRTEVAPYYNKVAWTLVERHLPDVLPYFLSDDVQMDPTAKELVEASAIAILQKYTGMEPEQIGEAIRQYQRQLSGQGGLQTPTADITQLAYQSGLDPSNPNHFGLLSQVATQQRELAQLRGQLGELTKTEEGRLVQSSQAKVSEQVESFKSNLFTKIEVPQGYDHVRSEIIDRINSAFERDPVVVKARDELEKFYRQGTPDLRAAASRVNTLQTKLSQYVKDISEPRLREVAEIERLKSAVGQAQQTVKNIPANTGTNPAAPSPAPSGRAITPDNAAEIALERYRQSKLRPV